MPRSAAATTLFVVVVLSSFAAADRTAPAPPKIFEGTILDHAGNPAAGASVGFDMHWVRVDEDGHYRLSVPMGIEVRYIQVRAIDVEGFPEYAARTQTLCVGARCPDPSPGDVGRLDARLDLWGMLRARVIDENGKSLVERRMLVYAERGWPLEPPTMREGPDGWWTIPVPEGCYTVGSDARRENGGDVPRPACQNVTAGTTLQIERRVYREVEIRGVASYPDGEPAAGIEIGIGRRTTITATDGSYSHRVSKFGNYPFLVDRTPKNARDAVEAFNLECAQGPHCLETGVSPILWHNVTIPHPAKFQARFTAADGSPLARADVTLVAAPDGIRQSAYWTFRTDSQGVVEAEMEAGRYGLEIRAGKRASEYDYCKNVGPCLTLAPGETLEIAIQMPPTRVVSGSVVNAEGEPASGAWVQTVGGATETTQRDGRFALTLYDGESFGVASRAFGQPLVARGCPGAWLVCGDTEKADPTLRIPSTATVQVTLTPAPYDRPALHFESDDYAALGSGAAGFSAKLPAGTYDVRYAPSIQHPGAFCPRCLAVDGRTAVELDIPDEPSATLILHHPAYEKPGELVIVSRTGIHVLGVDHAGRLTAVVPVGALRLAGFVEDGDTVRAIDETLEIRPEQAGKEIEHKVHLRDANLLAHGDNPGPGKAIVGRVIEIPGAPVFIWGRLPDPAIDVRVHINGAPVDVAFSETRYHATAPAVHRGEQIWRVDAFTEHAASSLTLAATAAGAAAVKDAPASTPWPWAPALAVLALAALARRR